VLIREGLTIKAKRLVPLCILGVATNVADECRGDRRDFLKVILIN